MICFLKFTNLVLILFYLKCYFTQSNEFTSNGLNGKHGSRNQTTGIMRNQKEFDHKNQLNRLKVQPIEKLEFQLESHGVAQGVEKLDQTDQPEKPKKKKGKKRNGQKRKGKRQRNQRRQG